MESFEDKGTCVIANGRIVAWFAEYTQETHQWCTDNYFGQWITWRKVNPPEIIPLTPDELKECERQAERFKLVFESDNNDNQ